MIDAFFANRLLPEGSKEEKLFLEHLLAISREGHLCLQVGAAFIDPPSENPDRDTLMIEGSRRLPPHLPWIHREGDRWYVERNWKFEQRVKTHLKRLQEAPPAFSLQGKQPPIGLEPEQFLAWERGMSKTFSIIAGGPGTGKSYVAACLVTELLKIVPENFRIVVAAPTGKAAAHLEAKLPKDRRIRCGTLHLLLGVRHSTDLNGEKGYLGADFLIVDECSMIDVRLFGFLLASLETGTRVILMGDENQLPPIEGGSVFADLVKSGTNNCTYLSKCLRSDRAEILQIAEAARLGLGEEIPIDEGNEWDFFRHFPLPSHEIPTLEAFQSICMLSCIRQGPLGVDTLNQKFANYYLSRAKPGDYFVAPILITKNDYTQKLYNGQRGILVRKIGEEGSDKVVFAERELPAILVTHFEYAYVLSVHKSQGSEYDHVILFVPPGSEVFGREMIYTGVTRARISIKLMGSRETLIKALGKSSRRVSNLI